jgi:hypothetical protein
MAKRRCGNWLHSFLDWTLPRSESPESIILWTGLSTLASVVKRRVYVPRSLMGSYVLYPHLYVIAVADPGVVRKTTSIGFGEQLLHKIPDVTTASAATSDSKLVETLANTKDGAISIISGEFGTFIGLSKEKMYELLTDLFDGKVKHDLATRMHGLEMVIQPCINLLAATTPKWLSQQPVEILTGGGFSSRVIYIFENTVRQREIYYDHLEWKVFDDLEEDLLADLEHIATLEGEFRHADRDTKEAMRGWYLANADNIVDDERVEGYFQRKPAHLHKVAMLLSISESDELVITMEHFQRALKLLEAIEKKMPKALMRNGKNPYSEEMEKVREYIMTHRSVPKGKLVGRFYNNLTEAALNDVLSALTVIGDVKGVIDSESKKTIYHWTGNGTG